MNALIKQLTSDTTALALHEGRKVGSEGHAVVRDYLLTRCKNLGLLPFKGDNFLLSYQHIHPSLKHTQDFYNIVGVIPGENRALAPILIGAHYDSVIDAPCADDNATSVAMTLAVAEHFTKEKPKQDLIVAFFDAEEPPFFCTSSMGSTRFHEDYCSDINFAGVIITDLIGHDLAIADLVGESPMAKKLSHLSNTLFLLGSESHSSYPEVIKEVAKKHKQLRLFPTRNDYIGNMSDHHSFEKAGQPFIFLSCGQGKYYHHPLDNLDWINFDKLACITHFVRDLIETIPSNENFTATPCDPYEFEVKMIKKAIGPLYYPLLKLAGKKALKTREDLDILINEIMDGVMTLK